MIKCSAPMSNLKLIAKHLIASISYYSGLTNRIANKASQSWRILMYHRVINPKDRSRFIQSGMYVKTSIFRKHIKYLAKNYSVVSLETLISKLENNEPINRKTVVITFDDGWLDTYNEAYPILKEHNIPATVFVPTKYIGTQDTLWTEQTAKLLDLVSSPRQKEQFNTYLNTIEDAKNLLIPETLRALESLKTRNNESVLENIITTLKSYTHSQREVVIKLFNQYLNSLNIKNERSFLNWEEIKEMSQNGISFGHHSHSHNPLTDLSEREIENEIDLSNSIFAENNIKVSKVFCFPEGKYSEAVKPLLFKKGFSHALTTSPSSDFISKPILLGRIGIHNDISSTIPLFTSRMWQSRFCSCRKNCSHSQE